MYTPVYTYYTLHLISILMIIQLIHLKTDLQLLTTNILTPNKNKTATTSKKVKRNMRITFGRFTQDPHAQTT